MFICMRFKKTKNSSKLDILFIPLRRFIKSGALIATGTQSPASRLCHGRSRCPSRGGFTTAESKSIIGIDAAHEWFEISPAEGIAIIQKWLKWVITRPY